MFCFLSPEAIGMRYGGYKSIRLFGRRVHGGFTKGIVNLDGWPYHVVTMHTNVCFRYLKYL